MSKEFWKAVIIRALHTMCQAALGVIGACTMTSEVDWVIVLDTAILAGICSILKSLVNGVPEAEGGILSGGDQR